MTPARRDFLASSAAGALAAFWPALSQSQNLPARREFAPQPGDWRTFEVTTRVDLQEVRGPARVWLPLPSIHSDYQKSLESSVVSNGTTRFAHDGREGARLLQVDFAAGQSQPFVELVSRVQTQSRAVDWTRRSPSRESADTLHFYTRPTEWLPTDGIVRKTALQATRGARTDVDKARAVYEWVVANTHREPKVRGCGEGDIKTMLETGNLGGKCADLNALFVGLCRAVGLPARDVYGIRLAPSAFGYKELSGNSASLKSAQHCRAEVYLQAHGWVGVDPADVAKVMRLETPAWIKTIQDPVVAPVNRALFGGWEGNWMAYNHAHDVVLPGAKGPKLPFFMYPVAEHAGGRFDSYAPDDFKYHITAREVRA